MWGVGQNGWRWLASYSGADLTKGWGGVLTHLGLRRPTMVEKHMLYAMMTEG